MLFTTHLLLCLAFGAKHIFADGGGAPNADKPQVDVKTADSDQGQRVPEETVQGKSITSTQSTQIVTSTLVLLFPGSSSSNSPSPESSRPTSPMPEPTAKKPNDVFCGTSGSANLDDCNQLLKDKDGFAKMSNEVYEWISYEQQWDARQALPASAARVACHETCCVFRHRRDNDKGDSFDIEQVRLEALELLGCGDWEKHEISVLGRFGGYGVCIADWDGGPDCFNDQDWTYGTDLNN